MAAVNSTDSEDLSGIKYAHILSVGQFNRGTLDALLQNSRQMARQVEMRRIEPALAGRTVASVPFEGDALADAALQAAVQGLGGSYVSVDKGAPLHPGANGGNLHDTVKTLACYADAIVLSHPPPGVAQEAAAAADALRQAMHSPTAIINMGDAGDDPVQALTDLYTIRERFGADPDDLTLGFLGDLRSASAAHSLIRLLATAQSRVSIVCIAPPSLSMPAQYVEFARSREMQITERDDLQAAIGELDVLYVTGVQRERFVTRHLEDLAAKVYGFPYQALDEARKGALRALAELDAEQEYLAARDTYVIDPMMLSQASKKMILMHPFPRAKEISEAVDSDDRAHYFRQVRNGLYIRMALLAAVLGDAHPEGLFANRPSGYQN